MCGSLHSCVFHHRLIYHSSGPAGACRLLCKAQSCAWLSKGLGFLGSGSHQSQLEYDTQWPQWSELVMSLVWLAVYLPLALPSPFCFISLSLSFTLSVLWKSMLTSHGAPGRVEQCLCYTVGKTPRLCHSLDSCIETDVPGYWFTMATLYTWRD